MVRRSYTPKQIMNELREAEVLLNQGSTVSEATRESVGERIHRVV